MGEEAGSGLEEYVSVCGGDKRALICRLILKRQRLRRPVKALMEKKRKDGYECVCVFIEVRWRKSNNGEGGLLIPPRTLQCSSRGLDDSFSWLETKREIWF